MGVFFVTNRVGEIIFGDFVSYRYIEFWENYGRKWDCSQRSNHSISGNAPEFLQLELQNERLEDYGYSVIPIVPFLKIMDKINRK